jgi:hypothetical protein
MGVAERDQWVLPWQEEVLPLYRIVLSIGSRQMLVECGECMLGHAIISY